MNHPIRLTVLLALLFLILAPISVLSQAPPGPVVRYEFRAAGLPQPAPFNVVQQRLHFDPGAATPVHTHPGQVFIIVLEGEVTFRVHGTETVYKAGDSFIELPNEEAQARNAGATRASSMLTYLLPKDAPLSHPVAGDTTPPPRPFVSYQFKTDVQPMTDPFDVVEQVLDFEPGAATPFHTHPGIGVVTVLEGELTLNRKGADTVYKAGESFVEVPNEVAQARNAGSTRTSVMASFLIPQGAPVSTAQPAPAAPATLPRTGAADLPWLIVSIAALVCLACGALARHVVRSRG